MKKAAKAVIFDLGNVLVSFDNRKNLTQLNQLLTQKLDEESLEKLLYGDAKTKETNLFDQYQMGNISTAKFFENLRIRLSFNSAVNLKQLQRLWVDRFNLKTETLDLLRQLKIHRRYILSDTNDLDATFIQKNFPEIFAEIDANFFSHQQRVNKYNHQAWKNVLAHSGLSADAHVFIDDRADHVGRAKELGIHGIIFTTASEVEVQLKKLDYL